MPANPKTIKGPTKRSPKIALARIGVVTDNHDNVSDWIDVHFNPASLQLQLSNELKGDNKNNQRKQYVAKTTTKLTMDLQFDTTDTGENVLATTRKLQAFVAPPKPANQAAQNEPPPPIVLFEWGALKFKGIAESYKETIDYFSPNGVPLRSQVNLTLSRQDQVFDDPGQGAPTSAGAVDAPVSSSADAANSLDEPGAARAIAAANGEESLRFSASASLTIDAQIDLKPALAFSAGASAGLGVGGSAGLNISGGAGFGVSGGAGFGVSGGASFGISGGIGGGITVGAGISGAARLSATEGAFAGLRVSTSASVPRLDPSRLLPPAASATLATDAGASFRLGGVATLEGAAGLSADVGASPVSGKITFDTF